MWTHTTQRNKHYHYYYTAEGSGAIVGVLLCTDCDGISEGPEENERIDRGHGQIAMIQTNV